MKPRDTGFAGIILTVLCFAGLTPLEAQQRRPSETSCAMYKQYPSCRPTLLEAFSWQTPLSRLRTSCRAVRDTLVRLLDRNVYPGLVFPFDSLVVVGAPYGGPVLDVNPRQMGGLSLALAQQSNIDQIMAPWSALYGTLGTFQASARGVVGVRFCVFPNAIFTLTVSPGQRETG